MPRIIYYQHRIDRTHQDSFWYDGLIAKLNGFELIAVGDIKVGFEINGEIFRDGRAVEEARNRKLTDHDLGKIDEFDGWQNNNWFEIISPNGDSSSDVCYTYGDAIRLLKRIGM
jgi:hypothetical protein